MDLPEEICLENVPADDNSQLPSGNSNSNAQRLRELLHHNADDILRQILSLLLPEAEQLRADSAKLRSMGGTGDMPLAPETVLETARAPDFGELPPWEEKKPTGCLRPTTPGQQLAWMHPVEEDEDLVVINDHAPAGTPFSENFPKQQKKSKVAFAAILDDQNAYANTRESSKSENANANSVDVNKSSSVSSLRKSLNALRDSLSTYGEDDETEENKAETGAIPNFNPFFGSRRKSRKDYKLRDPQAVFADATAMKEKIREAVLQKEYAVEDFYWDSGFCQRIAKTHSFQNFTLFVISFNAIWISIDTDLNTADTLMEADLVFQLAEHAFCIYFTLEWLVRFGAFKQKRDGLRDLWFVFDTALCTTMILETWVLNVILLIFFGGGGSSGALSNVTILKLLRLIRLTRMARMARLLRALPELIILIKGIAVAMRSVIFTLILLFTLIYFFAIVFTQLANEQLQELYFPNVGTSMMSLLLDAVLPDMAQIVRDCMDQHFYMGFLILVFILMASLTVMNMLIGVLCEVINVVSSVEKEQLTVSYVKGKLMSMFDKQGVDADESLSITKSEFESLVIRPEAAKIIQEIGVDVIGLVDFSDYIFQDGNELSFADFMELILQLRGSNNSTVKDIVDLRRCIIQQVCSIDSKVSNSVRRALRVALQTKEVKSAMQQSVEEGLSHQLRHSDWRTSISADSHRSSLSRDAISQSLQLRTNSGAHSRPKPSTHADTASAPVTLQVPPSLQQAAMSRPNSNANQRQPSPNQKVQSSKPELPDFSAKMWQHDGEKGQAANGLRTRQGMPESVNQVSRFSNPWTLDDHDGHW